MKKRLTLNLLLIASTTSAQKNEEKKEKQSNRAEIFTSKREKKTFYRGIIDALIKNNKNISFYLLVIRVMDK